MDDYKESLYQGYFRTHVSRKKARSEKHYNAMRRSFRSYYGHMLQGVGKDARVVDLGCGEGLLVAWLGELGFIDTLGIDLSQEMISNGQTRGVGNLEVGDITTWLKDQPTASCDAVFMRNVLEHFTKARIYDLVHDIQRVLKDNGRLILQVPNAESPFFGRILYGDFTHETAFNKNSIRQLLVSLQFRYVACHPVPSRWPSPAEIVNPFKFFVNLRRLSWKVIQTLIKFAIWSETGNRNVFVTEDILVKATK